MILGLIPARGGSKRIPRKNVRELGGQPLLFWTLGAALIADELDIVAVSSDDPEILDLAKPFCDVIHRPSHMAGDDATSYPTILHALDQYEGVEHLCLLQPTSPFRTADDIDACIDMLLHTSDVPAIASMAENANAPNGAIYVGRSDWLRDGGNFDGPAVMSYLMPPETSLDIDTEEDWRRAEEAFA